jgi:formylglycine-generating enzyme required for sulfatase activity/serine/threonine protein kinase
MAEQPENLLSGRYRLLQALGEGGFGETYLAEDTQKFDHQVVVKHITPMRRVSEATLKALTKQFEAEAKTLQWLGTQSNQIPSLEAFFTRDKDFYIVQEYIQGTDLGHEIGGKPRSENYTRNFLKEVCELLAFVHQKKVIHRDLKPQNIMRRQLDKQLVLIDFGAVKYATSTLIDNPTKQYTDRAPFTPGFAPTEQLLGKPCFASDVHAIGITALLALRGAMPELDGMEWDLSDLSVSPGFKAILQKMVQSNYKQRYADAGQVLHALRDLDRPPKPPTPIAAPKSPAALKPPVPAKLIAAPKLPAPPKQQTPEPIARRSFLRQATEFIGWGVAGVAIVRAGNGLWKQFATPKFAPNETVTVDDEGNITERRTIEPEYFTETVNGIGIDMVAIPGGTFWMGSPDNEVERDSDESPQHEVSLQPFYLGKFTVTQAQWRAVAQLPQINGNLDPDPSRFKGDNRPVERVSWDDAQEFCARLSQATGKAYQLPSEAAWEYAARAGTTTPFAFGATLSTEIANYNGNDTYGNGKKGVYREETVDVGSFPPNGWGLYDMYGNVWEWCEDSWHDNYNGAPTDGTAWIDTSTENNLLRGGSWSNDPERCRSADRNDGARDYQGNLIGFRLSLPRT